VLHARDGDSDGAESSVQKHEVVIIVMVLLVAVAVWIVLGYLFIRHIRRNKPVQETVGGVPVHYLTNKPRGPYGIRTEKPPAAAHRTSATRFVRSLDLEAQTQPQLGAEDANGVMPTADGNEILVQGGLPTGHDRTVTLPPPPTSTPASREPIPPLSTPPQAHVRDAPPSYDELVHST